MGHSPEGGCSASARVLTGFGLEVTTMAFSRLMRPVVSAGLLLGLSLGSGAAAQEGTPEGEAGAIAIPDNCTVIADGLINPRYVAVGDDGTVYVTETGSGGDEILGAPAPPGSEATPASEEAATPVAEGGGQPTNTRGYTGHVTMISPEGEQSVLATGFASYSLGTGAAGIVAGDGVVYVAVGGSGVGFGFGPVPEENTVYAVDVATGEVTPVVELGSYEEANNQDGTDVNPNLYGMTMGPDGLLYVADAGGNTIYRVDPVTGEFALHVIIPTLSVMQGTEPPADPARDRQPVPTGLAFAPDGTLTVLLLSEGWPAGAPSLLSVAADGTMTPLATDFSMAVGLAYGPDGAAYVSEMTTDLATQAPGVVLRVADDGSVEPVLEGLPSAHGIAFDDAGALYVVIGSLPMGPEPAGQVLRCEGVAGMAEDGAEVGTPAAAVGRD
jgi:glucose/arabinose dehydrogenase